MSYELQLIDTNCNDCKHMVRDFEKFKSCEARNKSLQESEFEAKKQKMNIRVNELYRMNELEKGYALEIEMSKLKYQYNNNSSINYGKCDKLNKNVSFIPVTCSPQNKNCFTHRKDSICN